MNKLYSLPPCSSRQQARGWSRLEGSFAPIFHGASCCGVQTARYSMLTSPRSLRDRVRGLASSSPTFCGASRRSRREKWGPAPATLSNSYARVLPKRMVAGFVQSMHETTRRSCTKSGVECARFMYYRLAESWSFQGIKWVSDRWVKVILA